MRKETIYSLASPYRDDFRITGLHFGDYNNPDAAKSCAIVGAMRGNEVQQLYIASKISHTLKLYEEEGHINKGHRIMVIPTLNHFSMNIEERFWAMDGTDINRMFPGYDRGETTQRIAYHVFESVKEFDNGIQLASSYMPGNFTPHVRMMRTDYTDIEGGRLFGLPYTFIRECKPYDTTTLNYNWQLWETSAFSLYSGATTSIDERAAAIIVESILQFLKAKGIVEGSLGPDVVSRTCYSKDFTRITSREAGFFRPMKFLGDQVEKGERLCHIIHPYEGEVIEEILAPHNGTIFYEYDQPFVQEGVNIFRMLRTIRQ